MWIRVDEARCTKGFKYSRISLSSSSAHTAWLLLLIQNDSMSLPLLRRPKRRKEHHIPAVNTLMCHKNRMLTWLVQTVEDGGLNFLFGSSVHPSGHLTPCTAQTSQCNMKKTPPTSPWQPPLVLNMLQLAGKKYSINFNVCVCVWLNCMKVKINLFYRNTFLCIYLQSLVNTDSALWLAVCKN